MKKSTKKVFDRWRKHAKGHKRVATRRALGYMIDSIEFKIENFKKELGEA